MSHCPSIAKDLAQARDGEGSLVIRATQQAVRLKSALPSLWVRRECSAQELI